jgi:hypothetical protein
MWALAAAFVVCCVVNAVIEPAPNGPEPDVGWAQIVSLVAALALLAVAGPALMAGTRWAPAAGVLAGLSMTAVVAMCPARGHHVIGWWWWVQIGLSLGLTTASGLLLAVEARSPHDDDKPQPPGPGPEPCRAGEAPAVARARADLLAGRLWLARDRLGSLLAARPADQIALDLMGEVLWRMGDQPGAGRFWTLTPRDDPDARAARAALEQRYRRSLPGLLQAIPARAPLESYPPVVQERLRGLARRAEAEGLRWAPGPAAPPPELPEPEGYGAFALFGFIVVLLGVGIWLLGLATLVYLLVQLLS